MTTNLAGQRPGNSTEQLPVTRLEVVDHLESAFAGASASKSEVLAEAEHTGARPEVMELLQTLPERRFTRMNELWTELQDVPIEL